MSDLNEIQKTRYAVFRIRYHMVFVTKYRKKLLTKEVLDYLKLILPEIAFKIDSRILEINGEEDHIHILVESIPRHSPATLVNVLKGVSSRKIRKKFPDIKKELWKDGIGLWSRSYYVDTVGIANLDTIIKYIENQGTNSSPS